MDITTALQGRGNGVEGGGLEAGVVVFGDNKGGHDSNPLRGEVMAFAERTRRTGFAGLLGSPP
jgi:hypothetical protein